MFFIGSAPTVMVFPWCVPGRGARSEAVSANADVLGVFFELRHSFRIFKEIYEFRKRATVTMAMLLGHCASRIVLAIRVVVRM